MQAVSFAREGFPLVVVAALVAAGTYALALNRRSWPLWLLAFALTIAALCVAYFVSDPRPTGPISFAMNELNVPVERLRVTGQ